MRVLVALMLIAMVAIVAIPTVSNAEANDTVCATTLQTALVALENACSGLQPGNVCLGFPGVQPSFLNGDTGDLFDQSGMQLALTRVGRLRSQALDVTSGRLGVAVLSFAAPNTAPAALAATGLIIGDVEMQLTSYSINVRTAFKEAANQCQQAPAMVILRSPDNTEASLYVNGAMILLNGMVAIHNQSANSVSFIVQQGTMQVLGGQAAQAGNTLVAVTDNTGTVMTWAAARPVNEKESQLLTSLQALTTTYKDFAVQVVGAPAPSPNCMPATHVVASGETLYRIALHYNTTMQSIIEANGISNPDAIYAGQALNIPCATGTPSDAIPVSNSKPPATTNTGSTENTGGGTGDTTQPSTGDTSGTQPTVPCGELSSAITSSFDGIANGMPGGLPMPSTGGGLPCN